MADNRLELVVEVDTNRANASIKSVNASLSSNGGENTGDAREAELIGSVAERLGRPREVVSGGAVLECQAAESAGLERSHMESRRGRRGRGIQLLKLG
jgi:hypothetical protein